VGALAARSSKRLIIREKSIFIDREGPSFRIGLTVTAKNSGQGYIGTNVFLSGIFCSYCYGNEGNKVMEDYTYVRGPTWNGKIFSYSIILE